MVGHSRRQEKTVVAEQPKVEEVAKPVKKKSIIKKLLKK